MGRRVENPQIYLEAAFPQDPWPEAHLLKTTAPQARQRKFDSNTHKLKMRSTWAKLTSAISSQGGGQML